MNPDPPLVDDDPILADLVAYLDGEMDAADAARVERRLADDANYRIRLQELQQTWDLLDALPRPQVSEAFTQSTVEMVAISAADEAKATRSAALRRRAIFALATAAVVLVASGGGYLIANRYATSENRQVLRDLPVIENVDIYANADSVEFLLKLEEEGLFVEDEEEESSDAP